MKNLNISIITVCLNSEKSIAYTLYSVFCQTYKNIEHVFVDGGSTDATLKIIKKHKIKKKIIKANKTSIYEAINLGIKKCTGDYVLILNSDDILNDKKTIENAVRLIKKNKKDIYLGNVTYFHKTNFNKIIRSYTSTNFKLSHFKWGLMPPHPGCFVSSAVAKKYTYNVKYKIAADFDFFLRTLKIDNLNYENLNLTVTRMRTGGVSGKNLLAHIKSGFEIYESLKNKEILASHFMINFRYLIKLKQFFFNAKYLRFKINNYYEKLNRYHFQILQDIKFLNFKYNFTLSALNLAFLGSYCSNEIKIYKNLIHWPDGRFAESFSSLKKIPGRHIIKYLKIPKSIKRIVVFGNLPEKSKKFLKENFHRKVFHYHLPYGSIDHIKKKFNYKIKKNEIILITLPTPKQEQLAEHLILKNKVYKIICIGGSINIASGIEMAVPSLLYNFEFLWRLRYETIRRLKRLIDTMFQYLKGKYLTKKLNNLNIKIIKKA